MQVAAQALTKQVPSLEAHIEDFVDAEDPEAGIEVKQRISCSHICISFACIRATLYTYLDVYFCPCLCVHLCM